ncbi:hypothetical protein SAOR_04230 [Salinisphaera orenii MK-B5]|uniref:Tat pathway signal sequence domain protein n=1 Tax=Salinisphaera orenii MK-B5 TaxID=856730 RepID=A0A423PUJ1_9GAMM|nr:hypothetical protein [Salinisphaera orenii]ROO29258.1 hypothetical protein SAOR_04230 [Salinisphaera orenii MK-B5]
MLTRATVAALGLFLAASAMAQTDSDSSPDEDARAAAASDPTSMSRDSDEASPPDDEPSGGVRAARSAGGIEVELNKLEPVDGACRAYLVTQNLTESRFESVSLDVVMFDNDGIVARRLAVQIAPMPPTKTGLKVFDIQDLACDDIGQLLLNNVIECRTDTGGRDDCLSLLSVSQRGSVPFIK